MLNDLCAAIRALRKAPSFTLVAVGVLALAAGAPADPRSLAGPAPRPGGAAIGGRPPETAPAD